MAEEPTKPTVDEIEEHLVVDQTLIEDIRELIHDKDSGSLINITLDLHDIDIADILNHLPDTESIYLFKLLNEEQAGMVLLELDESTRSAILDSLGKSEITSLIDGMDSDDAADVIGEMPEELAEEILQSIDQEDSREVQELLKYDDDTAGGIMATEFITVHDSSSVYDAIMEVKKQAEEVEDVYDIFVVNDKNALVGIIDLKTLIISPSFKKVSELMDIEFFSVTTHVDQEEVAQIMQKHDLVTLPVLNDTSNLVGIITIDDIIDVIREEAQEDIQKLTGINEENISDKTFQIVGARLPWLLVGLFGEMVSGLVITGFQDQLMMNAVLYSYIPLIMAMGGSTGVQSTTIVIQALTRGDLWITDIKKRLGKEVAVSFTISMVCATIIFLSSSYKSGSMLVGLTISGALIFVMINASVLGVLLPFLFKKLKVDPAIATGPFITTANDILGLTIYFLVASLILF